MIYVNATLVYGILCLTTLYLLNLLTVLNLVYTTIGETRILFITLNLKSREPEAKAISNMKY